MPKVENREKVNRSSSKGGVRKEERGGECGSKGLRCFPGSRVARNLHFSLLSFRFHHPLSVRTRWNLRAFERLANIPHREKASVASHGGGVCICVCMYVCMYVCIQLYMRCKDSPVIFTFLSSSYFYFRSSICLAREGNANLLFGKSAYTKGKNKNRFFSN